MASWFSIASGPLATAAVAGWMIVRLFRGAGPRRPKLVHAARRAHGALRAGRVGQSRLYRRAYSGWAQAAMQKDVEVIVAGLLLWIALSFGEKFATRAESDSLDRA